MKKNLFVLTIISLCMIMSVCCFAADVTLEGEGTQQQPYIISNKQDFEYFATNYTDFSSKVVSLESDIFLNDKNSFEFDASQKVIGVNQNLLPTAWTPIGTLAQPFSATFNGNGHMIFGLYCDTDVAGLFGYVNNANIYDLRVYSAYVNATTLGGILCASADGATQISDVVTSGMVSKNGTNTMATRLGGVLGLARENAVVTDCCSYADITIPEVYISYVGGIAADNMGEITDCAYDGDIDAQVGQYGYAGAIAGYSTGTITRCTSKGSVSLQSLGIQKETYIGGIVGAIENTSLSKCESAVSLTVINDTVTDSLSTIGGVVGYSQNSVVTNCKATTAILSDATYTGGIVGINNATNGQSAVSDCFNTANITAVKAAAGGIVGANVADVYSISKATIRNSLNTGIVDGVMFDTICAVEETDAGAVSEIDNCYSSAAQAAQGLTNTAIWNFSDINNPKMLYGTTLKAPATLVGLSNGGAVSADGSGYEYQGLGYGKAMYVSLDTDISIYGTHNAVVWFDGNNQFFASLPEYVSVYTVADAFETEILSYDKTNNKISVYIPSGTGDCILVIAEYELGKFKTAKLISINATQRVEQVDYTFDLEQAQGTGFKAFVVKSAQTLKPLGPTSWNQ